MSSLFVISLLVLLFISGCANQQSEEATASNKSENLSDSEDTISIGVSIQGFKGMFTNYIRAGIMEEAKKHGKSVNVVVVDAEDRADKQIGQIENFISQGADAIILNPVDRIASAPAVDAAVKAGIPIITVNTQTDNQSKASAFVGSDDFEAGKIQMDFIAKELGGKGNVAILHGAMGHSAQIGRYEGYKSILEENPNMQIIFENTAEWQTDKALSIVENWLVTGKNIDAIAANSDTMALGAKSAIDAVGKSNDILVLGMDAIPNMLKGIENGQISGTIWQDGIGQGKYSLDLAVKAAKGETIDDYLIPYELITKENIDKYKKMAEERDELSEKYN